MGGDIIDFTMLQKKGILQRVKDLEKQNKSEDFSSSSSSDEGFVDLTKMGNLNSVNNNSSANSSSSSGSNSSSSSNTGGSGIGFAGFFGAVDSGVLAPSSSSSSDSGDYENNINSLKIKLDDTDFKLQRAIERIDELEKKLTAAKAG